MMIGNICLALALPAAFLGLFMSLFSVGRRDLTEKARQATHLVTALVSVTSLLLIFAFVNDFFQIQYVASYSSRALPLMYKLTGIWAGLDGSLLFWAWLLTIFASIVAHTCRDKEFPYVNAVMLAVTSFFLIMLVFEANPFTLSAAVPLDGRGLNPLLQNFFMIFHPPTLYIGYVGFTVPFAYAIAALLMRKDGGAADAWAKKVRLWTIISWLFLTIGNLLGAMWAYVELGWGGFWAWDPVENAGILPWFTATAFLHSIIVQERRGMLKVWNIVLVILTFLLTIFGTFITRSGVIKSVHSFSDMRIGTYFLVFLSAATLFSIVLVALRYRRLRGRHELESFLSRESAFYMNNALFIFALVAVLLGTMLPLISELFIGQKMEVGPPFFNRVMAPVGVALLFLTGICPEMGWRRMRKGLIKREFLWPTVWGLLPVIVLFALGVRKWFPLAVAGLSLFTLKTIADEFIHSSKVIAKRDRTGRFKALFSLFRRAPRRYGGYVVHAGVVLLFIGIAGSSYQEEYKLDLSPGVKQSVAGYDLVLNKLDWVVETESEGVIADVSFFRGGKEVANLRPALFVHKNQQKPMAEVDFITSPMRDVYLALGGIARDNKRASLTLTINPLIWWVWFGGIVMIVGTVLALVPAVGRGREGHVIDEEAELDVSLGRADKGDFL